MNLTKRLATPSQAEAIDLFKTIPVPEGVTVLRGSYVKQFLKDNPGLTHIKIPEGVTHIGIFAFFGCSGLERVAFPASLEYIGNCAFFECSGLKSVDFPESLTH